jgi:hypothetical protein
MDYTLFENPKNVFFNDLVHLCSRILGKPRIKGSHHIFKTPYKDNPIINLQPRKHDKKMANPFQVRQVRNLFIRMEEDGYEI